MLKTNNCNYTKAAVYIPFTFFKTPKSSLITWKIKEINPKKHMSIKLLYIQNHMENDSED